MILPCACLPQNEKYTILLSLFSPMVGGRATLASVYHKWPDVGPEITQLFPSDDVKVVWPTERDRLASVISQCRNPKANYYTKAPRALHYDMTGDCSVWTSLISLSGYGLF